MSALCCCGVLVPGAPQFLDLIVLTCQPQTSIPLLQFELQTSAWPQIELWFGVQIQQRLESEMSCLTNSFGVFADQFHIYFQLCLLAHAVATRLLQLRRERIAERMKALQELVPNANKVCQIFLSFLPSFSSLCPFF